MTKRYWILSLLISVVILSSYAVSQEPDTVAPTIVSGPGVTDISQTSATVSWGTDEPATGVVECGTDSSLTFSAYAVQAADDQEVVLMGLIPNTQYLFRVVPPIPLLRWVRDLFLPNPDEVRRFQPDYQNGADEIVLCHLNTSLDPASRGTQEGVSPGTGTNNDGSFGGLLFWERKLTLA